MSSNDLLSVLLKLHSDITVIYDLKKSIIEKFYKLDNLISSDITLDEFLNFVDLNDDSKAKINSLFQNTNFREKYFIYNDFYEKNDGKKYYFSCKGFVYDDDKIIISLTYLDKYEVINEDYDKLTKAYTRNAFIQKAYKEMAKRNEFLLIIVDFDRFKSLNEKYGQMFGDFILVEIASRLKNVVGDNGFVGRNSGDQFIILYKMPTKSYDQIREKVLMISSVIRDVGDNNFKNAYFTATLGISSYPFDGEDFDLIYKKAKKALNRGKSKGGNCFIIYDVNKSGPVDLYSDDEAEDEHREVNTTSFSIINSIYEILNRDSEVNLNITDSMSLVGNYFQLDRINIMKVNPDTREVEKMVNWCNSKYDSYRFENDEVRKGLYEDWFSCFDKEDKILLNKVDDAKNLPIYDDLTKYHSKAMIAFRLKTADKDYGLISFEMCSNPRTWSQEDIASLMVIAKDFAILFNNLYIKGKHEKELYYDNLTGLYNIIKFKEAVNALLLEYHNTLRYSLINISILNYKNFSNKFGIDTANKEIISFTEILNNNKKDNVIYCRVIDDNFLVFYPSNNKKEIDEFVAKIDLELANVIHTHNSKSLCVGIYINESSDELFDKAIEKSNDARMQYLKSGKEYNYFSDELYKELKFKTELEIHMHKAIEDGEFLLYLQPKVNTETGKVVGAEALTRWNFKKSRLLTPNQFIPLFEQNGFINELDYLVFENVCKFQRRVIDSSNEPVKISVNVSRYQRDLDKYIDRINEIKNKYNIPANLIEIEITEGMYVDNINMISLFIDKLHENGYSVSMDDFGSGYSNLSSLATLDFDTIKLDKEFCSDINNIKETKILKFIMNLAKELEKDVLCEGVETVEFMKYLRKLGCVTVQGYLYDRPIKSDDFYNKYIENKYVTKFKSSWRKDSV